MQARVNPKDVKMATAKLNLQDRKDLEKYTRFLALKAVQVIVQSRLGEKVRTKSKPHSSGADWFNLSIKDLPEVMYECKKAFADQLPSFGLGMCVEISLKTVDGDAMVLETWCLEMQSEQPSESSVRVRYTVYNRMSLLLKSLIAVTRVTPAYKLSSCQGPDSFVICYRLFMGETQWSALGECYERVRVGRVDTPVGTLAMSVAYRTQLTISPQKVIATRDSPFMVKSDHFDGSPKWTRPVTGLHFTAVNTMQFEHKTNVTDEIIAACEDCPLRASSPSCPINGFQNGSAECKTHRMTKVKECNNALTRDKQVSFSDIKKIGAFAPSAADSRRTTDKQLAGDAARDEYLIPNAPFSSLLEPALILGNCNNVVNNNYMLCADDEDDVMVNGKNNANTSSPISNGHHANNGCEVDDANTNVLCSEAEDRKSNGSEAEDFVLVELKPPFAGPEGTATTTTADLGSFFRDCQSAPPLASFSDQPSLADQVDDLGDQLAAFETNQHEFDEFVDYLCHAESMPK